MNFTFAIHEKGIGWVNKRFSALVWTSLPLPHIISSTIMIHRKHWEHNETAQTM